MLKKDSELESSYVKAIAKELIYRYKDIDPFRAIDPSDIIFLRDESLKTTFKKDIEIYLASAVEMATTGLKFVVFVGKTFDNLSKNEQYRKVFHTLCHIPIDYKEQHDKKFKIELVSHDFEIFKEESTFIHDVEEYEKERDIKDNQVNIRRGPAPY